PDCRLRWPNTGAGRSGRPGPTRRGLRTVQDARRKSEAATGPTETTGAVGADLRQRLRRGKRGTGRRRVGTIAGPSQGDGPGHPPLRERHARTRWFRAAPGWHGEAHDCRGLQRHPEGERPLSSCRRSLEHPTIRLLETFNHTVLNLSAAGSDLIVTA